MKRRHFIYGMFSSIAAAIRASPLAQADVPPAKTSEKVLKGFIVSDAHYGWDSPQQPTPEAQARNLQTILKRFPDLDLMLDTGDAFHSNLDPQVADAARTHWSAGVANGCKTVPFFYLPGNHDLAAWWWPEDAEWRDDDFGAMPCRPYFSFDLKGIHFIAIPELQDAVFISRETMEWLKLDLEINKDRTIVMLAHNNIVGTTTPLGEPGYRGLVNGNEVITLFQKYPNVLSWMNGHNHTFEVMQKYNMLFVSNGRFGGFVPPPAWQNGPRHVGGIYFEVHAKKLVVRSYSAEADKFFDEMGYRELSSELARPTTVQPDQAFTYSYGVGGMVDGQKIPAFNHYAGPAGSSELFVTGTELAEINDDPTFLNYAFRDVGSLGNRWTLFSASVRYEPMFIKENTTWKWENPGFRLLAQPDPAKPLDLCVPDYMVGKYEYYRCAPGNTYEVALDLESISGGQKLQLDLLFRDKLGRDLATVPLTQADLAPGKRTYSGRGKLPAQENDESIYSDPSNDNMIQLTMRARFTSVTNDVIVHRVSIRVAGAEAETFDPVVLVNGLRFAHQGKVGAGEIIRFDIPSPSSFRDVYEVRAGGSKRAAWIVRHHARDWQVRNASVADHGDHLEIGPLRNRWSPDKEVVIVPLTGASEAYIHRLQNIQSAKIYPLNRKNSTLQVQVAKCSPGAKIIVSCSREPRQVRGATAWRFSDSLAFIEVNEGARVEIS